MKIDLSPLEHGLISASMMFIIGIFTGNWFGGALFGIGFFLGREHSEAEYRWMDWKGVVRTGKETIGAFDPHVWSWSSTLDFLVPVLVNFLIYTIILLL